MIKDIKKIRQNSFIILIVTIIVLYFLLKDDFQNTIQTLMTMKPIYVIISSFFFILSVSIGGFITYITINNSKKVSLKEAIKHNFITQFFNGITPFSTGGQPMQVYMLTEHNLSIIQATNVTISNFIYYQTALIIYGIIAVILNYSLDLFPKSSILSKLVGIGFLINTLVGVFLILITYSPKFTKSLILFLIKILNKIKIIKDKEIISKKIINKLDEFHENAKKIRKNKKLLFVGIMLNFISLTFLYIIPFFLITSLDIKVSPIKIIAASAYTQVLGSFVPIPGATGGIEYGYTQFVGMFIKGKVLSATLIAYRFITYYLGMIVGGITLSFDSKMNNKEEKTDENRNI